MNKRHALAFGAVGLSMVLAAPVAFAQETVPGVRPAQTVADYEQLVEAMAQDAGTVALIPEELVDCRIQAPTPAKRGAHAWTVLLSF